MAKVIRLIDDLDASPDGVDTYRFALEGVEYEIDLCEPNAGRLRMLLAPFIAVGRRVPRHRAATRAAAAGRNPNTTREIRTWWAANADREDLPPFRNRGAIPQQVQHAYRLAQPHPHQATNAAVADG